MSIQNTLELIGTSKDYRLSFVGGHVYLENTKFDVVLLNYEIGDIDIILEGISTYYNDRIEDISNLEENKIENK